MIVICTNHGEIRLQLDSEKTPKTTANFLEYVKSGFYDGTLFHRVIDGFMIQGGGMEAGLVRKETNTPIENEAKQGLNNKRGTIAMARTSDPHSATAQFFINLKDNAFLDFTAENIHGWGYCAFGNVVDGMDVVDAIAKVETTAQAGHQDVPQKDVLIERIYVEE